MDFRKMAADAKSAEEARVAALREASDQAKKIADDKVDLAIQALNDEVRPILNDAVAAFASEGIDARVVEMFDVRNRMVWVAPSLKFSCFSRKRGSDNYQSESAPVFFASDGQSLSVGLGENGFDKEPKKSLGVVQHGNAAETVARAIKEALDARLADDATLPW